MFPDSPAQWVALGLPDFDTKEDSVDPRIDFMTTWAKITTPFPLETLVDKAARRALEETSHAGDDFPHPGDRLFVALLRLCYFMDQECEGREFFLSARDAGRVLEASHTTASQLLRLAEKAGYLVGRPYDKRQRAQLQAKRWQFIRDRVPMPSS